MDTGFALAGRGHDGNWRREWCFLENLSAEGRRLFIKLLVSSGSSSFCYILDILDLIQRVKEKIAVEYTMLPIGSVSLKSKGWRLGTN